MKNTLLVCGHGGGISHAVARRFGSEGFAVAIVARNAERLAVAAARLQAEGIDAQAFPCDLRDPTAVRAMVRSARQALGPIAIVHWNASLNVAGDILTAPVEELAATMTVSTVSAVGILHHRLAREGVYVGEVVVVGTVKGGPFDNGHATLEPSAVADEFWELHTGREVTSVNVS